MSEADDKLVDAGNSIRPAEIKRNLSKAAVSEKSKHLGINFDDGLYYDFISTFFEVMSEVNYIKNPNNPV